MARTVALLVIAGSASVLSGCAAGLAAGAIGAAARSAQGTPKSNAHLAAEARAACAERAAQHGSVHIIDVQQRRVDRITVWGSVGDGAGKRSFECSYGTKITGFKLRAISPPR